MQPKAYRKAAIDAAQSALLEKVRNNPEKVMEGLLKAPHLLYGIHDVDAIFDIMLEKGMYDKLVQLAGATSLPKAVRSILVSKLL